MIMDELAVEEHAVWLNDVYEEDSSALLSLANLSNEAVHGSYWQVRQQLLVIAAGISDLGRRRALARYAMIIACNDDYFTTWARAVRPLCEMALAVNCAGELQELIAYHSQKPAAFWRNL